jgi:hypothetical protein
MAQHTRQQNAGGAGKQQPAQGKPTREGDEPQDLREAKPDQRNPDSKDRGRDRNPGDMQRDENDQNESDVKGTGFDESDTELDDDAGDADFTGEDETNATSGSHSRNPNPRSR